jgi:FtsP/CotA-like multicopper oxidase with cupredoxin domain
LRVRRGEELKVRLLNELPEPTAIHWHGIRNTNATDGVPGPTQDSVAPGVILAFWNGTAIPNVAYLHGHHFRLLDNLDDGWKPFWLGSVLVPPRQIVRIAFVADNPGNWVLRCRSLGPQEAEPAGWFEVT